MLYLIKCDAGINNSYVLYTLGTDGFCVATSKPRTFESLRHAREWWSENKDSVAKPDSDDNLFFCEGPRKGEYLLK